MLGKPKVFSGRYTAQADRDFVVFIIGMRVNKWWKLSLWWRVAMAMPRMLKKLMAEPSLGMLGHETFFRCFPTTIAMISYWESFEHLDRFAKDRSLPHAAAWQDFLKRVGNSGDVGIYHETYQVNKKGFESIYVNMPKFGLAAALKHEPLKPGQHSAKDRLHGVP